MSDKLFWLFWSPLVLPRGITGCKWQFFCPTIIFKNCKPCYLTAVRQGIPSVSNWLKYWPTNCSVKLYTFVGLQNCFLAWRFVICKLLICTLYYILQWSHLPILFFQLGINIWNFFLKFQFLISFPAILSSFRSFFKRHVQVENNIRCYQTTVWDLAPLQVKILENILNLTQ